MKIADAVSDRAFHALADPSRRAIFDALASGEAPVKELTARFDISQPAVSQHLAVLRQAGLVESRREGRLVYYRIDPRGVQPLIDWLAWHQGLWATSVRNLEDLLDRME